MAYIIKTSGEVVETSPKNGVDFTLEEMKNAIGGGYIELVRPVADFNEMNHFESTIIADEDGWHKNLDINHVASDLAGGIIVGDILLIHNSQIK